jgi:hypothetical protein
MKPAGRIAFLSARAFLLAVPFLMGVCGGLLRGQDTRTVAEPSFPPTCITLAAQLTITAGEPSSETAFDTTRIESALNGSVASSISMPVESFFCHSSSAPRPTSLHEIVRLPRFPICVKISNAFSGGQPCPLGSHSIGPDCSAGAGFR